MAGTKKANSKTADKVVVLVTCSTPAEADVIARALVEQRLAACVNVLQSPVRSTYHWKGKVETASENLLLIKTSKKLVPALHAAVRRLHSYEVPEVIALPIVAGSVAYLEWVGEWLREPVPPQRGRGAKRG